MESTEKVVRTPKKAAPDTTKDKERKESPKLSEPAGPFSFVRGGRHDCDGVCMC
jgi:hypothetical protein